MTDTKAASLPDRASFDQAVDRALEAAAAYYDGADLLMTDADYDALVDSISEASTEHPDWDPRGVLDQVAAGASAGGEVTHPVPMLSLAKAKDPGEVDAFVARLGGPVCVEVKLDGLAVRAEYRDGVLALVATRGDGMTGEDVTSQAAAITGLPRTLTEPVTCEVRGEVFMTDEDFRTASANRVAAGKPAFVNPRNATAGSLRNSDATYEAPMTFACYEATGDTIDDLPTHAQRLGRAHALGVQTAADLLPDLAGPLTSAHDALARITEIGQRRAALGFPIDGAVVKADLIATRDALGAVSRTPRWAVAFKYPPDTATTLLTGIEVAVGRTGRISLTALLEPVFVGGTTISRATLHHPGFVADADIRVGDTVYVYRAGDVIPRVNAPVLARRPEGLPAWQAPETCPQCGGEWDKSSLLWRCHTPECSVTGRIEYAASRDVLDIEGLGGEIAVALTEAGLVNSVADLFALTVEDVAALPVGDGSRQVGTKVAEKIVAEIGKARTAPLARLITCFGIRGTGRTMGRRLAAHFRSLEALRAATLENLTGVEGIGAEKARLIFDGLRDMAPIIDRMLALGVSPENPPASAAGSATSLPLAGKKVCVTGSVPGLSRNEANEAVETLGGTSASSVSKATDLVVVGDGAGSKADKAAALGITIMPAEEFAALLASVTG